MLIGAAVAVLLWANRRFVLERLRGLRGGRVAAAGATSDKPCHRAVDAMEELRQVLPPDAAAEVWAKVAPHLFKRPEAGDGEQ